MNALCGRLVIAGAGSGVGKTSMALGITRALRRRGLRVQPFKVGPDFLDPTYLKLAAGRTCYNLDGWMSDRPYVESLFDHATADADMAVIEGVMGMFDGADPTSLDGSTAQMAQWLDAPVLLVVGAHGLARTLAAVVKGFVEFEPGIQLAGVIANRCGSEKHQRWLAESLASSELPPLVGAVPREALPTLQDRHLGLVTADRSVLPEQLIEQLADACDEHLDVQRIMALGREVQRRARVEPFPQSTAPQSTSKQVRIGVARDEAFHFCYPDNLELLARHGAEVVPFSPLSDDALPEDLHGLYLPGGYPEEHAERLSANRSMAECVRQFADSGKCIYAECGGLMYLGQELETLDGRKQSMAGVLPIDTRMLPKRKTLGYVEVTLEEPSLFGPQGTTLRGHEFHYSEITDQSLQPDGWRQVYRIQRRDDTLRTEGFQKGNILASYVHLHWASQPAVARHFVNRCKETA